MSLSKKKDSPYWYTRFSICGVRVQESTRCTTRKEAERYETMRKAQIKEQILFGGKEQHSWPEAVLRYLKEVNHKGIKKQMSHFRWLQEHLNQYLLCQITKEVIIDLCYKKEETGASNATINRMLDNVRAVLVRAKDVWGWLEVLPQIPKRKVSNKRLRWITRDEANRLINELPEHLSAMAKFTLMTGLRMSNVMQLKWEDIDLIRRELVIHPDKYKSNKYLGISLNDDAIQVIREQIGKNQEYVFTYLGNRIKDKCNTKAFRNALQRANIKNFRWHDLRHTWASWHVQNGTSLQDLMELGGWSSFEMVLRYAHLSKAHLKEAAQNVSGADLVKRKLKVIK